MPLLKYIINILIIFSQFTTATRKENFQYRTFHFQPESCVDYLFNNVSEICPKLKEILHLCVKTTYALDINTRKIV